MQQEFLLLFHRALVLFLCNHVFYVAQSKFAGTKVRSGFVHVPLMDSQAPEFPGMPTMPLDQMVTAVRAMLETIS
jgi:pyroglutamyl-peptidase